MGRTNKDRILGYLRSVAHSRVTNSDICGATGVQPHQQVFQIAQKVRQSGVIQAARRGREWVFWVDQPVAKQSPPPRGVERGRHTATPGRLGSSRFEEPARSAMSIRVGAPLSSGKVPGVPKEFDMFAPNHQIVGDSKYYTLVRGKRLPPAKFATIAEHVWLLEKTGAPTTFLVFGNQREVPVHGLDRYGSLPGGVDFYFLTDDGELEQLAGAEDDKVRDGS